MSLPHEWLPDFLSREILGSERTTKMNHAGTSDDSRFSVDAAKIRDLIDKYSPDLSRTHQEAIAGILGELKSLIGYDNQQ